MKKFWEKHALSFILFIMISALAALVFFFSDAGEKISQTRTEYLFYYP